MRGDWRRRFRPRVRFYSGIVNRRSIFRDADGNPPWPSDHLFRAVFAAAVADSTHMKRAREREETEIKKKKTQKEKDRERHRQKYRKRRKGESER